MDPRLILDLRCFGRCRPSETNSVTFDESCEDLFGMPQPTFNFELSEKDSEEGVLLMEDMCRIATSLGGYLPGAEPKFMKPGTAVHITVSNTFIPQNPNLIIEYSRFRSGHFRLCHL